MSMTGTALFRWDGGELRPLEYCDPAETSILAADSWLVSDGHSLAIDLHRERFFTAVELQRPGLGAELALDDFWSTALEAILRAGNQFPRVELQLLRGTPVLVLRRRPAPELKVSITVATHSGPDPRTQPMIKGPDTAALLQARTRAQQRGADEAIILSPDGFIVEGAYSAMLWWRGGTLCAPSPELERVDSVTARSVIALATALGVEVHYESVPPDDLDGLEVWALSALHGIRIVTAWLDGPSLAEEPGRLSQWRARLDRLRKPLPAHSAH
ncbi:MAG TPA: aminotransferase class IV [Homoserinimonas sp.]|nr:aminotransferase class IV [Homoserinimonas sp.]